MGMQVWNCTCESQLGTDRDRGIIRQWLSSFTPPEPLVAIKPSIFEMQFQAGFEATRTASLPSTTTSSGGQETVTLSVSDGSSKAQHGSGAGRVAPCGKAPHPYHVGFTLCSSTVLGLICPLPLPTRQQHSHVAKLRSWWKPHQFSSPSNSSCTELHWNTSPTQETCFSSALSLGKFIFAYWT